MDRNSEELGARLAGYADAIAGFSFAQAVAFCFALGSDEFSHKVVRGGWLIPIIIVVADGFYAILLGMCHGEEDGLLGRLATTGPDVTTRRIRQWRYAVVGLAAFSSVAGVCAIWYGSTHSGAHLPILFWESLNPR